jgi:hypothetical protein
MLFSTNKLYEDKVLGVKKGDLLFLLNIDSHVLYGAFKAKSDGRININPEAWGGKYPFQVEVEKNGEVKSMKNAEKILSKLGISWKKALGENKTKLLLEYLDDPNGFSWRGIVLEMEATQINDTPRLEATTLWDYPRQSYGKYFDTVDIICVARRSQTSNTGIWYNRALRFNFYLRGFKYLFIMKKPPSAEFKLHQQYSRVINWARYSREKATR